MEQARAAILALLLLAAGRTVLQAQSEYDDGWLASGFYVGALGQYRIPLPAASNGYDGSYFTVIDTGDRLDTPTVGDMRAFGASIGYIICTGKQEPAFSLSASWSMTKGSGDSSIGSLSYIDHEISFDLGGLIPIRSGFALTGQIGGGIDLFTIENGLLPYGKSREDLLLASYLGFDIGAGAAYVIDRRFLVQAKTIFKIFNDNMATGEGVSDGVNDEISRAEFSFELSAGWIF